MAGRKVLAITDRQFAVLRVLWQHGPLTVRELMEHFLGVIGSPTPRCSVCSSAWKKRDWWSMTRRDRLTGTGPSSHGRRRPAACSPIFWRGSFTDRPSSWSSDWSMLDNSPRTI